MEIEKLAEKLEALKPEEVRKWRRARDTADAELRSLLDKQLLSRAHRTLGDYRGKILLSLPPEAKAKGAIHLGTILYEKEKWPFGISDSEPLQNVAIFGRSGAGKTNVVFHILEQLVQRKTPFLFLDWKRTARHLTPRLGKRIRVYTAGRPLSPFPFNPFVPPPGLEPNVYINHVVDIVSDAYTLRDGSRSILQKAIAACYEQGNVSPTAGEVAEEVKTMPGTDRVAGWKVTALRALESIGFSEMTSKAKTSQAELVETLLSSNTVLELDALSQSAKKFLVPLPCLWLYHVRLAEPEREKLRLVIFVEEAHHVLFRETRRAKESVMSMLLRQCREIGIGMVVVDQHPHLISSAALGNT